jgi:hypothetical protein
MRCCQVTAHPEKTDVFAFQGFYRYNRQAFRDRASAEFWRWRLA